MKALLPSFQEQLPASVTMNILFDRSESIRASVADVKGTLLLTLILVVLVIFLFLRNISATVIPSLALPMSIVGTFVVLFLMGFSLDNLSLMALTLSVGFVVDDAIVMLENIVRHMEMGESPHEAALNGSREIGFTILSMTLALTAVFIPILFMGGILGRLFHEFAITISAAILISGFVSLSLTPMLSSRFLRPSAQAHHGRVYAFSERFFGRMLHVYEKGLSWSIRHRRITMLYSAVILALTVVLFAAHPEGVSGKRGHESDLRLHRGGGGDLLRFHGGAPEGGGGGGRRGSERGRVHVLGGGPRVRRLQPGKPLHPAQAPGRARSSAPTRSSRSFAPSLPAYPACASICKTLPPSASAARAVAAPTSSPCRGRTPTSSTTRAQAMLDKMKDLPGLQDVTSDLQIRTPEVNVDINRDRASALGISVQQVESSLADAFASGQVSTIYAPNNEYSVILELLPEYRMSPAALSLLYVRSSAGALVPLSTIASLREGLGPASINHLGQLPSVTLSFNLKPGVALGDAVTQVQALARTELPATISTSFQGTAQAFQSSLPGTGAPPVAGHSRHLPRAGHPLRELHPPAHDSLRPALRRVRRPGHAAHLQDRSGRLRLRRASSC